MTDDLGANLGQLVRWWHLGALGWEDLERWAAWCGRAWSQGHWHNAWDFWNL